MPLETIEAFQDHGEVRGDTVLDGIDEAQTLIEQPRCRRGRLRRRRPRRSRQRACRSSSTRSTRSSRASGRSACEPDGGCMTRQAEIVERIWARDPTLWTGADEAKWLGWLDEPWRMREDIDLAAAVRRLRRRPDRRGRAARDGRLVARARGDQADVPAGDVPRPRHDASAGDPRRSRRRSTSDADAVHLGVEVRLDARDALAHRLLLGADAATGSSGSRSPIPARRSSSWRMSARFRAIFPGEPTIGGRYSALSPFGMVPAALMGVDLDASARPRRSRWRDACRLRRGQPGARARALARRGLARRPRQGLHRAESRRLRPLGRAAARGVDRQARQGADPGARRVGGRAGPPGAGGAGHRTSTSSARSSSAGSSRPRSRARFSGSTRSTSPTCKPRRTRRRRSSPPATSR